MKNEKILLLILALVQFTHILDFMIIMPLGGQFMRVFDINPQQFSLLVSSYAISASVMGLLSAFFIDRFDRKQALLLLYVGFTIGTLACSLAPNYIVFLIARSFTGAFGGVLTALVFAIVGDTFPYKKRAGAMGWVMTAFSISSVVGVPMGIFLAATFNWRAPFIFIGLISLVITILAVKFVPSMNKHLENNDANAPKFQVITNVLNDSNQLLALLFTVLLMLGHFSIIPFIAPYMQFNIGFSDMELTYIYAVGGVLSAFLLPAFGKIADKFGNAKVFSLASFFALFSIFAITNLPEVSILIALCATSSYFVVASGRNVPATTLVTSVVKPESRGSFMSIRSSVSQFTLGMSSVVAGFIIVEQPDGSLNNYELVGYLAIIMSVLAIALAWRLKAVD